MKNNYHSQNKPLEIIALIQVFLILLLLMSSHIIIYNFTHMQSEVPDLRTFFSYRHKPPYGIFGRNREQVIQINQILFILSYFNIYDFIAIMCMVPCLYILKHKSLKLESILVMVVFTTGGLLSFQPSFYVNSRILDLALRNQCYMWLQITIFIAFIIIIILWLYIRIFFKYSSNGITLLSNTQIILLGIPFVIIFSLFVSLIPTFIENF